jgi:hypothetical protein
MKHALLAIVYRLEEQLDTPFVVLADSGYPASSIIGHPRKDMKSKFICSVSSAKVAESLQFIAEAAIDCLPLNRNSLIWSEKEGLVAYCHHQKTYTQVLVTNACIVNDAPPPSEAAFPILFREQGLQITRELTRYEQINRCTWSTKLLTS